MREGPWKLHLTQPPTLYQLTEDVAETHDVAAEHPEVVQRLMQLAEQYRRDTGAEDASRVP
jgi:arylsulfatase